MPLAWQVALGVWLALNLFTFGAFAWDKWRAVRQAWRVPEKTLITCALLGGWPAAYLAMRVFRHKTSKPPFRRRVLIATLANVALLALAAYLAHRAGIL